MELRIERIRERLDLYEKLMRLDKPHHTLLVRCLQPLKTQ